MNISSDLGNNTTQSNMVKAVLGVAVIVITFSLVFFLIHGSYGKPSYSFSNDHLTISGQFGTTINLLGATVTHELSQIPSTPTHTNGAAIGNVEKGYFKLASSDVYLNVMDETASDYVLITDKSGSKYYINCVSSGETDNLYKEISEQNSSSK